MDVNRNEAMPSELETEDIEYFDIPDARYGVYLSKDDGEEAEFCSSQDPDKACAVAEELYDDPSAALKLVGADSGVLTIEVRAFAELDGELFYAPPIYKRKIEID